MPEPGRLAPRHLVGAVAVAWGLLLAPAGGTPGAPAAASRESQSRERLESLHAAIETAFDRCDPAPLGAAFSTRVKTFLSSRSLKVKGGYYGADQALAILRRAFAGRTTLRFRLRDLGDDTAQENGRHLVPGRWVYRDAGDSKSEARLVFTLAPEAGRWYLREIREQK